WWDLPKSAVKQLTRDEAADIYRALYWNAVRGDELPAGLDLALFDYAVNSGPARAIKAVQTIVGTKVDGVLGPLTLRAIEQCAVPGLVAELCDGRLTFLQRLATFAVFGKGWTGRV